MEEKKRIRTLEGLGYCSAVMIVASLLGRDEVLHYFYYSGLTLGLIVIVRLLAINALARNTGREADSTRRGFGPSGDRGEEVTR